MQNRKLAGRSQQFMTSISLGLQDFQVLPVLPVTHAGIKASATKRLGVQKVQTQSNRR